MKRIVSLLPSATEIVCHLGFGDQLVGVTHECDYPAFVQSLPRVTRTAIPETADSRRIDTLVREQLDQQTCDSPALYSLDIPLLEQLQPDVILTQGLCDVCAVSQNDVQQAVASLGDSVEVLNLEPTCLEDVFRDMLLIANRMGEPERGAASVAALRERVDRVATKSRRQSYRPRVVFLEWIDPLFSGGHWNPELVEMAGGAEQIGSAGEPSRTISWDDLCAADPEVLFIACCGYNIARATEDLPILRRHPGWSELPCVRTGRVYVSDGNAYFNRPGPRLIDSLEILATALWPEDFATLEPDKLVIVPTAP